MVADRRPLVRRGLRALIDSEPDLEVVAELSSRINPAAALRGFVAPVVVLDAELPDGDLPGLIAELTRPPLGAAIVLLVEQLSSERAFEFLRLGARAVLERNDGSADLLRAIRMLAAGEAFLSPRVAGLLVDGLHRGGWQPRPRTTDDLDLLTTRECEIFRLVAEGRTNRQIAGSLFISEATVKSHFNRIGKKLRIANRV
ncbi:response regulator transcription factor [Saccharopolyspora shandongensis]|uniref:response regulator transcription factor n=1 Tax=Saccharopolyspora shandongensis TaxID=418495 RepID=UPI0033D4F438